MAIYSEVTPDVLGLAADVISHHHPKLLDARIGFIFQDEASTKLGKVVLGSAQRISDKQRVAGLDMHYLVTIARDMWVTLTTHQKKALLDHELCHCDFTYGGIGETKMRGHDIEEFQCIIDRYGLWKQDLQEIAPSFQNAIQSPLPGLAELKRMGAILSVEPAMVEAI